MILAAGRLAADRRFSSVPDAPSRVGLGSPPRRAIGPRCMLWQPVTVPVTRLRRGWQCSAICGSPDTSRARECPGAPGRVRRCRRTCRLRNEPGHVRLKPGQSDPQVPFIADGRGAQAGGRPSPRTCRGSIAWKREVAWSGVNLAAMSPPQVVPACGSVKRHRNVREPSCGVSDGPRPWASAQL